MRKLFLLLLLAVVCTLGSKALTVENTAGRLSSLVTDTQITQLTVTGTMDASDFLFITEELTELTSIDLSAVTIEPLNSSRILYGTVTSYFANEIPRTAFFGKKLTSVSLPSTIESIGFAAFAGCYQLQSITLPASLSDIGDYAFAGSALTSVAIPSSVMFVGNGAFARCESLESVSIKSGIIGDFAFMGAISLNDVTIGASVTSIGKGAFGACTALKTIKFDNRSKLTRIDDEAFINSGLESIDIKNMQIGTVGDWAFAQTKLSNLNLPGSVTYLGEGALAHNPLLTSVMLPDVLNTSSQNFNSRTREDFIDGLQGNPASGPNHAPGVHRSMERLYAYTFAGDENLNAGNILRPGLKYIGDYTFYNVCQEIDTMRLPSSVLYLGDYAMAGMTGMAVLKTAASEVPALGENVWAGVDQPSVPLVTPSDESTALYKVADQWMNFFFDPGIPDYIIGDVNNDGYVNLADVAALINYMLTGDGSNINMLAADVNQDSNVNVGDLSALISILLTANMNKPVSVIHQNIQERFVGTGDMLSLPIMGMKAGETRTIDVALLNSEHNYTALQCELVLPQGLTLDAVEGIERGSGHGFSMRQHNEPEVFTIIGVSTENAKFAGSEGNVMRLTLTADDTFNAQDSELLLTNVLLVTPTTEGYLAGDALTRLHDESGVEQVNADKVIASVRYINVAGQQSEEPFDGLNIIVTTYTDGTSTTTKVVK